MSPPKNGEIALRPNSRVVKCKYYVSQKQNDKIHWSSIALTSKVSGILEKRHSETYKRDTVRQIKRDPLQRDTLNIFQMRDKK